MQPHSGIRTALLTIAALSCSAAAGVLATQRMGILAFSGFSPGGSTAGTAVYQQICGNGILEAGEECDDGNQSNADACGTNCIIFQITCNDDGECGDGESEETCPGDCGGSCGTFTEHCDDDSDCCAGLVCVAGNTCNDRSCGNGVLETGEQCDDGNVLEGDGCSAACTADDPCSSTVCAPGYTCTPYAPPDGSSPIGLCLGSSSSAGQASSSTTSPPATSSSSSSPSSSSPPSSSSSSSSSASFGDLCQQTICPMTGGGWIVSWLQQLCHCAGGSSSSSSSSSSSAASAGVCGNGIVEGTEQCDAAPYCRTCPGQCNPDTCKINTDPCTLASAEEGGLLGMRKTWASLTNLFAADTAPCPPRDDDLGWCCNFDYNTSNPNGSSCWGHKRIECPAGQPFVKGLGPAERDQCTAACQNTPPITGYCCLQGNDYIYSCGNSVMSGKLCSQKLGLFYQGATTASWNSCNAACNAKNPAPGSDDQGYCCKPGEENACGTPIARPDPQALWFPFYVYYPQSTTSRWQCPDTVAGQKFHFVHAYNQPLSTRRQYRDAFNACVAGCPAAPTPTAYCCNKSPNTNTCTQVARTAGTTGTICTLPTYHAKDFADNASCTSGCSTLNYVPPASSTSASSSSAAPVTIYTCATNAGTAALPACTAKTVPAAEANQPGYYATKNACEGPGNGGNYCKKEVVCMLVTNIGAQNATVTGAMPSCDSQWAGAWHGNLPANSPHQVCGKGTYNGIVYQTPEDCDRDVKRLSGYCFVAAGGNAPSCLPVTKWRTDLYCPPGKFFGVQAGAADPAAAEEEARLACEGIKIAKACCTGLEAGGVPKCTESCSAAQVAAAGPGRTWTYDTTNAAQATDAKNTCENTCAAATCAELGQACTNGRTCCSPSNVMQQVTCNAATGNKCLLKADSDCTSTSQCEPGYNCRHPIPPEGAVTGYPKKCLPAEQPGAYCNNENDQCGAPPWYCVLNQCVRFGPSCSGDAQCGSGRRCYNGSCSPPACNAAHGCPYGYRCNTSIGTLPPAYQNQAYGMCIRDAI